MGKTSLKGRILKRIKGRSLLKRKALYLFGLFLAASFWLHNESYDPAGRRLAAKLLVAKALPIQQRLTPMRSGAEFLAMTAAEDRDMRIREASSELAAGNIPDFLREMSPIQIRGKDRSGHLHTLVIWVMRDYLALGTDDDFVRMPLTPAAAKNLANRYHMMLPTTKLVNLIYEAAAVKLAPRPLPASEKMASNSYFARHDQLIEREIAERSVDRTALVAGHKKDVVISSLLAMNPDRVAIYGWHTLAGKPIQPLSIVHDAQYLDYSHGIRFISREARLDGKDVDLMNVLLDENLTVLVSNEEPATLEYAYQNIYSKSW